MVLQCQNKVLSILLCLLDVVFEARFRKWDPPLCDLLAVHGSIQDDLISNGDATHMCRVTSLVVNYTKKVASCPSLKKKTITLNFEQKLSTVPVVVLNGSIPKSTAEICAGLTAILIWVAVGNFSTMKEEKYTFAQQMR